VVAVLEPLPVDVEILTPFFVKNAPAMPSERWNRQ